MSCCADTVFVCNGADVPVHSQVLRLVSAEFDKLFQSQSNTASVGDATQRIVLNDVTKEEFYEFHKLLQPLSGRKATIDESNVDAVLKLSVRYDVEPLKQEALQLIMGLPVSIARLLQAREYGLNEQYERCADNLAFSFQNLDLTLLADHPQVMMDVASRAQTRCGQMSTEGTDAWVVFDDGELPVHSTLLRLASPVIDAMLSSGMEEMQSRRINVSVSTKEEFAEFYRLLQPLAWDGTQVTENNVEGLLALSSYYQVEAIREQCAQVFTDLDPTMARLLLSRTYGLTEQYEKFADAIALSLGEHELSQLKVHPEVIMDLMVRIQSSVCSSYAAMRGLKPRIVKIRERATHAGWVDVRDDVDAVLASI